MDDLDDRITTASQTYEKAATAAEQAKNALFDVLADAIRTGRSAEDIAGHVRFSAAYIRRIARERGAQPLPPGPKRTPRRASGS